MRRATLFLGHRGMFILSIKHGESLSIQEQLCEQRLPATEADSLLDIVVKNCNTIKYDICLAQEFIVTQVNIPLICCLSPFFLSFGSHCIRLCPTIISMSCISPDSLPPQLLCYLLPYCFLFSILSSINIPHDTFLIQYYVLHYE